MLPPNQRFNALHSRHGGTDVDFRQIFQYEFVLSECAFEFAERNRWYTRQMRHQKLLDGDWVERSSSDPDHAKPLRFGGPPGSGKYACMHSADEKCGGLCSLECEKPQ